MRAPRGTGSSGGILVRVRIGDDLHELSWEEWEARVRAGRIPEDALVQFEAVTSGAFVRAADLEMYRSLRNDAAIEWQGRFLAGPPPVLTALLVGVQVRIWWWARIPEVQHGLVERFTNWAPPALEDGEVWRLLTMGFLHTDTEHLVLNMMWLAYTGWNIERALGRLNLATLYVAAVLGGALLSMFGSPETQSLGASGGVYGLIGASVVFGFVRPELLPRRGRRLFGVAILPYLVLMFWSGLMNEQTDNWAHLGGLLAGAGLVLLLDPEPLQRRPGWNLRIRGSVLAIAVVALLVPAAFGPRLEPIDDAETVRTALARRRGGRTVPVDPDAYRAVVYEVPTGWKPGLDLARGAAFTSPVGGGRLRAWSVRGGGGDRLTSPEALASAWVEDLRAEYPDAEVGPFEPATLAGHEALRVRAVAEECVLEWRGAARGTWTLQEVWQVDARRAGRLAPLVDRLRRSVEWSEPEELRKARLDHEHLPNSPKTRGRLAVALARAGELDEAFALHRGLVDESPADAGRWLDALDSVSVASDQLGDVDQWYADALDATSYTKVIVAVAESLRDQGRLTEARGVLEIAWVDAPGDRQLRRARRRMSLAIELDETTGEPWDLVHDPHTGEDRSEADQSALRSRPLTLSAAAAAGRRWEEERARLARSAADAVRGGDPESLAPLLVLREGHLPVLDADLREAVASDLERAIDGRGPGWMPEEVQEAARERPELPDAIRNPPG